MKTQSDQQGSNPAAVENVRNLWLEDIVFHVSRCYVVYLSNSSLTRILSRAILFGRAGGRVQMVFMCYPSTPRKVVMNLACFVTGVSLFAIGAHLSYANIAPQQARIKARSDFVKEHFRKKFGTK
ncbi:hypothetical protein ACLOJK_005930 [Asimina triloba]